MFGHTGLFYIIFCDIHYCWKLLIYGKRYLAKRVHGQDHAKRETQNCI